MRVTATLALALCALPLAAAPVAISRASFNPQLKETVTYTVKITEPGTLTARIIDRDTYVTKTLASAQRVAPGTVPLTWDGTDDKGTTVADEAWSLRLDFRGEKTSWTYFPASTPTSMVSITPDFFDRTNGVLRYTLATPSRVHLQAGIGDYSTKQPTAGAVMKTLVNRAPRPGGAVIEQWTGMDESGTIYVPALKNFVVAIAATPLPENCVITYGNRSLAFLQTALHRTGLPILPDVHANTHHQGLTALDDATPRLTTTLSGASFDEQQKLWRTSKRVHIDIGLRGDTAERFAQQPGRLVVYVDQLKVVDRPTSDDRSIDIELPNGADHIVAVNWASDYGPVAASAFRTRSAN